MIPWLAKAAVAGTLVVGEAAPDVQGTIELAQDGDTVVLPEGTWAGPAELDRPITLTSQGGVLDGQGEGSALVVSAPGAVVDGLQVRGSGTDLGGPDACIYVAESAHGSVVQHSRLWDCAFGIWVHRADGSRIEGNEIRVRDDRHPSERGNGIQLFGAEDLEAVGNDVEGARDGIYVSATHDSRIAENQIRNVRYGIHYMYSHRNRVVGNVTRHNTGGIALMQSHHLEVVGNVSTDNERRGILVRDARFCSIRENHVARNGEGLFFYASLDNEILDNHIVGNQVGARVWAGTHRNVIAGNAFLNNAQQIFYVAHQDQEWGTEERGNRFSDYLGWDQTGDGRGDRPYRAGGLVANLLHQYPHAVFLLNSPAFELLSYLEARTPALRTPSVVEPRPELH